MYETENVFVCILFLHGLIGFRNGEGQGLSPVFMITDRGRKSNEGFLWDLSHFLVDIAMNIRYTMLCDLAQGIGQMV